MTLAQIDIDVRDVIVPAPARLEYASLLLAMALPDESVI